MDTATNLFRRGFHHVIPVIPPGAVLSPGSKLKQDSIGKVPGRRNGRGLWSGFNWREYRTTFEDVQQWDQDRANIGLRTSHFPAIDIDSTDATLVEVIRDFARARLGTAPCRIGNAPKALLLYRTEHPFKRLRLWITKSDIRHLVEVLGDGQQFVAAGIHPKTNRPYTWDQPIDQLSADSLTLIDRDKAESFLKELQTDLEARGFVCQREGSGGLAQGGLSVDQSQLKAPNLEALTEAVALIPNTNELFPGRDDYLRVGYAIRAAAQDNVDHGFDVFLDWALKWEGNDWVAGNDPDVVRDDWGRMKGPYRVGWPYIADLARRNGYCDAVDVFEADPNAAPPPSLPAATTDAVPYSEQALADQVIAEQGDQIRSVPLWKAWLVWGQTRWLKNDLQKVQALVAATVRKVAVQVGNAKLARSLCSASTVKNVLSLAGSSPRLVLTREMLGADPWLLNTPSGIVDLRTGEVGAHDPGALLAKITGVPIDREHDCPRWKTFLLESTGGNADFVKYLQRFVGYCLTGSVREHVIGFIHGPGGNGKSVFVETLAFVLGLYAVQSPMSTFMAGTFDRHPTELAALHGARLVTANETNEGDRWNEARLKSLSGGDRVAARFLYGNFFEFSPQCKLCLVGNHKPQLANVDDAIRRRLHLIPFIIRPPQPDLELPAKLREEGPAILAWMIEGCLDWQREGLAPPAVVRAATEEYFSDEDALGRWLAEECVEQPEVAQATLELFSSRSEWCRERGEDPGSSRRFAQVLINRGYKRWRDPKTRRHGFAGVQARPAPW